MIAFRTCKVRYDPWDGTGAALIGGRWNSPGRAVIYAADSFPGSLLEILAHTLTPRTLPGRHHAARLDIGDDLVEDLDPAALPGWYQRDSPEARSFGDQWLEEARTPALAVPALPSRPIGRVVLINPVHPDAARITRGATFAVPWDERLFQ
ncbi:MAG TPA: RES domain-containing protein [Gemmatimonadales bacterium]|jgi:RES domain-containing protein